MKTIVEHLTENFRGFEPELKESIIQHGKLVHLEEGDELMSIGGEFKTIPLITEGSIKVNREDDQGNELFLYYLSAGQTCALSLNCFLMSTPSEVYAVAEEKTTLIALEAAQITHWMTEYESWRKFVVGTYQLRFQELLGTIDGIAFKKLDERLYDYIKERVEASNSIEIKVTHQQIAEDLNSTREVISRLLKILEDQGKIVLGRGKINLV